MPMPMPLPSPARALPLATLCVALLAGCASTTVTLTPAPQPPVCDRAATALVLWAPQWRPDQKDVPAREAAAAAGLARFFASDGGCFARTELRRVAEVGAAQGAAALADAGGRVDTVVSIGVRELGPVVRLLSSPGLVEGGTEVVLQVVVHRAPPAPPSREFGVRWQHGGPGVVKGVAGLPDDMLAALRAGLHAAQAVR